MAEVSAFLALVHTHMTEVTDRRQRRMEPCER
jgi:hypothetical protein